MEGYVLIPGGGMGSWAWTSLVPYLKTTGRKVLVLDKRIQFNNQKERKKATIDTCADYIVSRIKEQNITSPLMIAHSGGAIPGMRAMEKIGKGKIAYIAANIPGINKNALDSLPFPIVVINYIAIKLQQSRNVTPMAKYQKIVRNVFCNTSSKEVIDFVLKQELQTEPPCLALEARRWSIPAHIPQMYIKLMDDKTITPGKQEEMAGNMGIKKIIEMKGNHMIMLSNPEELSKILLHNF